MSNPEVSRAVTGVQPVVIWQPFTEQFGAAEPAILLQRDACGLFVITQEGRDILIMAETINTLIRELKLMSKVKP